MPSTRRTRLTPDVKSIRARKMVVLAALAALATTAPAAAAMPEMGAVDWMVFKHPQYGCPTHVDFFVSSYATHWPDGDTAAHAITWTIERIGSTGKLHKYASYTGAYRPLTEQNGKQVTEFSSFDKGIAAGLNVNNGFTNKFKLIILKPFHWESEWNPITVNCFS